MPSSSRERGRLLYASADWQGAYDALMSADQQSGLAAGDLELLGRAGYMLGRDDDYVAALERAYREHLAAGTPLPAVRCAFWIGHSWLFRGQASPANGWFARAERLLEPGGADVAERGYLLVVRMLELLGNGDAVAANAAAVELTRIGERFEDPDLVAMGLMEQGHTLMLQGKAAEGSRLIDESMVAVTTGELSPIVAGIVYCNTIAICRDVYQLRRVQEWTRALTRWCEAQPTMVAHKGVCLVHRAEILTLAGAWDDALDELQRLTEPFTKGALNRLARGDAAYREAEVLRLRGSAAAESRYLLAGELGREPLPGLALLRLQQGSLDVAAATMRRGVAESPPGLARVALLPAYVEIMLAVGDIDAATVASRELAEVAAAQDSEAIEVLAKTAQGAVLLAAGDAPAALPLLRGAMVAWQELGAPYEAARTRALVGRACRLAGDEESAARELRAAREAFAGLGAGPDLAALAALDSDVRSPDTHGLSPREREVLRLVAGGASNRQISATLVLSEHTVARHLQNIFLKLQVSSRTAASAYAHQHHLV